MVDGAAILRVNCYGTMCNTGDDSTHDSYDSAIASFLGFAQVSLSKWKQSAKAGQAQQACSCSPSGTPTLSDSPDMIILHLHAQPALQRRRLQAAGDPAPHAEGPAASCPDISFNHDLNTRPPWLPPFPGPARYMALHWWDSAHRHHWQGTSGSMPPCSLHPDQPRSACMHAEDVLVAAPHPVRCVATRWETRGRSISMVAAHAQLHMSWILHIGPATGALCACQAYAVAGPQ